MGPRWILPAETAEACVALEEAEVVSGVLSGEALGQTKSVLACQPVSPLVPPLSPPPPPTLPARDPNIEAITVRSQIEIKQKVEPTAGIFGPYPADHVHGELGIRNPVTSRLKGLKGWVGL